MKRFEPSRAVPLALISVVSLWLSVAVAGAIAAQGIEATAALRSSQPGVQTLLAQPNPAVAAAAARDRAGW